MMASIYIILTAFLNSQTGLAYDIMSSGEMFAEFKGAFSYFKQHWWKYVLVSIISGSWNFLISFNPRIEPHIEGTESVLGIWGIVVIILMAFIAFIWNSIINEALASINAQGSFTKAIVESFRIFRANPKRLLSTWGLYSLIFVIPSLIFEIIIAIFHTEIIGVAIIIVVVVLIINIFNIFIGLPLKALIITGIYNNIEFNHFPTKNILK
jgi:hypothetical protein